MLSYYRPAEGGFHTLWFQCSQDGWDPFAGSKFTLEFQADSKSEPGHGMRRLRFHELLSNDELEQVRDLQNRIIQKLTRPPGNHWVHGMPDEVRRGYLAKFDSIREPFTTRDDIWLRYIEDRDVRCWADFLLNREPPLLDRFALTLGTA